MFTTPDSRRRVARAAAFVTAAAAVTGTWTVASAAQDSTDTLTGPQPTATAVRPEPTATAKSAPVPGSLFVRTELYFGTDRKTDPDVTLRQFNRFVDEVVTPRFPDGLTQLEGNGQFLGSTGPIEEKSYVIVLLYPRDDTSANREIEEIRNLYKEAFSQESVLRADSTDRVSF